MINDYVIQKNKIMNFLLRQSYRTLQKKKEYVKKYRKMLLRVIRLYIYQGQFWDKSSKQANPCPQANSSIGQPQKKKKYILVGIKNHLVILEYNQLKKQRIKSPLFSGIYLFFLTIIAYFDSKYVTQREISVQFLINQDNHLQLVRQWR